MFRRPGLTWPFRLWSLSRHPNAFPVGWTLHSRRALTASPDAALSDTTQCNSPPHTTPKPLSDAHSAPSRPSPPLRRLCVVRPDLIDEWVPELNDVDVSSVASNSPLSVWWRCAGCGENYAATVFDRAVREKGCPRCAGSMPHTETAQTDAKTGKLEEKGVKREGNSLAETHPHLVRRWDTRRNGPLRPSDVRSDSDLAVWWLPAEAESPNSNQNSSPNEVPASTRSGEGDEDGWSSRMVDAGEDGSNGTLGMSFRRPVYVFVAESQSYEEQQAAQAALEMDILRSMRSAARIEEACASGVFPIEDSGLDAFVAHPTRAVELGSPASSILIGEDVHKALEVWEQQFDAMLDQTTSPTETVAHSTSTDARHVTPMDVLKKKCEPLFAETESDVSQVGTSIRAAALEAYGRFIDTRRSQSPHLKDNEKEPHTCSSSDGHMTCIPSVLLDPNWMHSLTTMDTDVAGHGIAPSAQLHFAETPQRASPPTLADSTQTGSPLGVAMRATSPDPPPRRLDSLPTPPEEYSAEIFTSFPSRPPYPRAGMRRNCSVSEFNTFGAQEKATSSTPSPREVPVTAAFSLVSLTPEIPNTHTADETVPFDVDETAPPPHALLGQTAMRAMTEAEVRALQYGRTNLQPRRTGKFRLRMPSDGGALDSLSGERVTRVVGATLEGEKAQTLEAPGTPRKVARPRKRRDVETNT